MSLRLRIASILPKSGVRFDVLVVLLPPTAWCDRRKVATEHVEVDHGESRLGHSKDTAHLVEHYGLNEPSYAGQSNGSSQHQCREKEPPAN